jgi:hypothetical protein
MKKLLLFSTAAFVLMASITISCGSKKSKSVATQQLALVEPFDIIYSEGGGLTGLVESYHLSSSGSIDFMQKRPGQQDSLVWSKQVPANELVKLQQSLLSSTILNQPLNSKGNMTSYLTYTTADSTYSLSWPMSNAPEELSQWIGQLKNVLKQ